MQQDEKRLFFGYEVNAPWPQEYPKGRLVDPSSRHMTIAFLGNISYPKLQKLLPQFPPPSFKVGSVGIFDSCLLLPEKHPHVVAWHVQWYEKTSFNVFQQQIVNWLIENGYPIDQRPFLPHVTMARSPFNASQWLKTFTSLPIAVTGLHLYESVGNLCYQPLWSYPLLSPFDELDHATDIAFNIKAESMSQLHLHALMALAFKDPLLLRYIKNDFADSLPLQDNLNDIVIALNQLITRVDSDVGCPMKAVSFHGDVNNKDGILTWKMVIC